MFVPYKCAPDTDDPDSDSDSSDDPNWSPANLPPPHPAPKPGQKPTWMPLLAKMGMNHGVWSLAYCESEAARRMQQNEEYLLCVHYKGPTIVNPFTGMAHQLPSTTLIVPPESVTNLCDPAYDYSLGYLGDEDQNMAVRTAR